MLSKAKHQSKKRRYEIEAKSIKRIDASLILTYMSNYTKSYSTKSTKLKAKNSLGLSTKQKNQKEASNSPVTHLLWSNRQISSLTLDKTNMSFHNITYMDLRNNHLTSLEGIHQCTNLQYLFCNNNSLTSIPPLPSSLLKLNLSENALSILPSFSHCIHLKELWVNDQRCALTIPPSIFSSASPPPLQHLDISNNHIHSYLFLHALFYLRTLISKNNVLTEDSCSFFLELVQGLPYLESLDLRNKKNEKSQEFRRGLILVSHNALKEINGVDVTQNEKLYLVNLQRKRMKCSEATGSSFHSKGGREEESKSNEARDRRSDFLLPSIHGKSIQ